MKTQNWKTHAAEIVSLNWNSPNKKDLRWNVMINELIHQLTKYFLMSNSTLQVQNEQLETFGISKQKLRGGKWFTIITEGEKEYIIGLRTYWRGVISEIPNISLD